MKARVLGLSALAVIVALGILGMHAAGFGHGPMTAMTDAADLVHEPAAHASAPSTVVIDHLQRTTATPVS